MFPDFIFSHFTYLPKSIRYNLGEDGRHCKFAQYQVCLFILWAFLWRCCCCFCQSLSNVCQKIKKEEGNLMQNERMKLALGIYRNSKTQWGKSLIWNIWKTFIKHWNSLSVECIIWVHVFVRVLNDYIIWSLTLPNIYIYIVKISK